MADRDFGPSFRLKLAAKDAGLVTDAVAAKTVTFTSVGNLTSQNLQTGTETVNLTTTRAGRTQR